MFFYRLLYLATNVFTYFVTSLVFLFMKLGLVTSSSQLCLICYQFGRVLLPVWPYFLHAFFTNLVTQVCNIFFPNFAKVINLDFQFLSHAPNFLRWTLHKHLFYHFTQQPTTTPTLYGSHNLTRHHNQKPPPPFSMSSMTKCFSLWFYFVCQHST